MYNFCTGMNKVTIDSFVEKMYWFIPLVLLSLQAVHMFVSMNQIRYEELAEAVRNVYWLKHNQIYDGISSNVGWYGTILLIYNFFGFNLFSAKFFRLILALVSLYCLAGLFAIYFRKIHALLPLITIGLSPTILFFNTLQSSFGMDLQYLPICLFLVATLKFKDHTQALVHQALLWIIVMIAWMSYPSFVVYLPILVFLYLSKLRDIKGDILGKSIGISVLTFFLPILTVFLYVQNKDVLFFDPAVRSGIFRAAGRLQFNFSEALVNIKAVIFDLFYSGGSYYFEVAKAEFSDYYPAVSVIFVFGLALYLLFRDKKLQKPTLLAFGVLILSFVLLAFSHDSSGMPGIRRATGILAAFYALFALVWYFVQYKFKYKYKTWLLILFFLLPIHHIFVYPSNLEALKKPSEARDVLWFSLKENPQKSFNFILESVQKEDLYLSCKTEDSQNAFCRYNEVYAAVGGACEWNRMFCHKIYGYDFRTNQFVPLSIDLWQNYYWPH